MALVLTRYLSMDNGKVKEGRKTMQERSECKSVTAACDLLSRDQGDVLVEEATVNMIKMRMFARQAAKQAPAEEA
jgi:hypothetical protein